MSGGSVTGNQLLDTGLMIAAGVAAPELAFAMAPELTAAGGLGAAALTGASGAALSGGVAAVTGQDVGKAALMGGIGSGLGSYLAGPGTTGLSEATRTATETGAQNVATNAAREAQGLSSTYTGVDSPVSQLPMTGSVSPAELGTMNLSPEANTAYGQAYGDVYKNVLNNAAPQLAQSSMIPGISRAGLYGAGILGANELLKPPQVTMPQSTTGGVPDALKYKFDRNTYQPSVAPYYNGVPTNYPQTPYAQQMRGYADGGTVEQMSRENATGGNQMFPQSGLGGLTGMNRFQNATNTPMGTDVIEPTDAITDPYTGAMRFAQGGVPIELHGTADISGQDGGSNGYGQVGSGAGGASAGLGSNNGYNSFINSGTTVASSPSSNAYYDRAMQGFNNDQRRQMEQNPNYRPSFNPMQQPQSGSMDDGMVYKGPAQQPMTQMQMRQMQQNSMASGGITSRTSPTGSTYKNTSLNYPTVKQYIEAAVTPSGLKQVQILAQNEDINAIEALNQMQGQPVNTSVKAAQGGIMGYAKGGDLGSYSDGGRMLKGPGDGMSDDIPASIGGKQPARLADGEFVVPADVVSHLGNGSTDAGAKHLYAMMDKVRSARTGRKAQGKQIKPEKYMPA